MSESCKKLEMDPESQLRVGQKVELVQSGQIFGTQIKISKLRGSSEKQGKGHKSSQGTTQEKGEEDTA